jgi:MoaA/NifB/PqqE/SkfB family radical SAM enzyme
MNGDRYIMPHHIQIETVGGTGMCTARCEMCTIADWQKPPRIMENTELFKFVDDLEPFKEHIRYVTLHCNGEPLMDKHLHEKVAYLKQKGFVGTGFATNCTQLTPKRSQQLLDAGLDTIICSIDGIKAETHETIRKRTNFNKIVGNVEKFLELRNAMSVQGKETTRVIVRFIMQDLNKDEYPAYKEYWSARIDPSLGDQVVYFPIHNWGGQTENWKKNLERYGGGEVFQCEDMYERFIVFSDGDVSHCDADYNGFYDHGNVFKEHFLKIYNGEIFNQYRTKMEQGRLCDLKHCVSCSIPLAREERGS